MAVTLLERRRFLQMVAAAAATSGPFAVPSFAATSREAIIEAAKHEGGLLWYDHYDRAAAEAILAAFQRSYPFVKRPEFVDVPSAQKTAKLIQESMAGGPTADIILNDAAVQKPLFDRGLLLESDFDALGVVKSPVMTPTSYMVLALTPPYVLLYNTNLVKDVDVPKSWDEAVGAKWQGRTGHWMRTTFFVNLIPAIGEDQARDLARRLAALRPRLFDGQFPLAQAVGSGEIALAIVAYDSAVRIVEKGAPAKFVAIEPTPFGMICAGVMKYGRNPNTARLFQAWLASPEGAIKFETMTKRGNYFVEGTETSKFLKGRKLAYHTPQQSIDQAQQLNALEREFSRMLAGR